MPEVSDKERADVTPPRSPEIDQRIEALWVRLIEANTGRITTETRALLSDALSKERLDALLKKGRAASPPMITLRSPDIVMKRHGMQNIVTELTKSGVGMFPYIQKRMEQKMKREAVKTIDRYPILVGAGVYASLETLVRDPDSSEALVLAWLYGEVVSATNWHQYADIFDSVDEHEVRNVDALQKMQKLYREIAEDKSCVGIGLDPDEDTGGVGSGHLKALRKKVDELQKQASDASKVKKGNPDPFLARADKVEEKIETLNNKKKELIAKLTQFNTCIKVLHVHDGAGALATVAPLVDIEALAQDFNTARLMAELPNLSSSYAEIGGKTQAVDMWLQDDEFPSKADQVITQYREAGRGLIPASIALRRLQHRILGTPVGMNEQEVEQLRSEVWNRMLSGQGPDEPASKEPGPWKKAFGYGAGAAGGAAEKAASGGKKGLGKLWEYFTKHV